MPDTEAQEWADLLTRDQPQDAEAERWASILDAPPAPPRREKNPPIGSPAWQVQNATESLPAPSHDENVEPTGEGFQPSRPAFGDPAFEYVQPDRSFKQNVEAGVRQSVAQNPLTTRFAEDFPKVANWQARTQEEARYEPASGVGGFIGGMAADLVSPTPENIMFTGAGSALGAGAMKLIGPVLGRVEALAGAQIAKAVEHGVGGAGTGGTISGLGEAAQITDKEWREDPWGSLARITKATAKGAAAFGAMGAAHGALSGAERAQQTTAGGIPKAIPERGLTAEDVAKRPLPTGPEVPETGQTGATETTVQPPESSRKPSGEQDVSVRPDSETTIAPRLAQVLQDAHDAIQRGETPTPVPESPATVAAQVDGLIAGKRPAMLVTPGEAMPTVPEGFRTIKTDAGVFIFDPAKVKAGEIRQAVKDDTVGEVLGYGIADKPSPQDTIGTVVVRRDGVEVQAVVTDEASLPRVTEAARAVAEPGDTIKLENPIQVIKDRVEAGAKTQDEARALAEQLRIGEVVPERSKAGEVGAAFRAIGSGIKEAGDKRTAKMVAERGYVQFEKVAAIDLFEKEHPDWRREEPEWDGPTRFYPPTARAPEPRPAEPAPAPAGVPDAVQQEGRQAQGRQEGLLTEPAPPSGADTTPGGAETAPGGSRQPWEMSPSGFLDWTRTSDFKTRRAAAEQAERQAETEVLRLEQEIGTPSESALKGAQSASGISAKSFGMMQLADAARQQREFDAALAKMPPEFRAKYDTATKAHELAHARTRSFEDLNTAKQMASDYPDLAKSPQAAADGGKAPQEPPPPPRPRVDQQAQKPGEGGVGAGHEGEPTAPSEMSRDALIEEAKAGGIKIVGPVTVDRAAKYKLVEVVKKLREASGPKPDPTSDLVTVQPVEARGVGEKIPAAPELIATETLRGQEYQYRAARVKGDDGKPAYEVQTKMANGSTWDRDTPSPRRSTKDAAIKAWAELRHMELAGETDGVWNTEHPTLLEVAEKQRASTAEYAKKKATEETARKDEESQRQERIAATEAAVASAKFKRGEVNVVLGVDSGGSTKKPGWILDGIGIWKVGDGKYANYILTHQESGKRIGDQKSLATAKAAAVRLHELTDWTKSEADLNVAAGSPTFVPSLKQIMADPYGAVVKYSEKPRGVADKADAIADAAADRIKKRGNKPGPNAGGTTIFDDVIDAGIYAAAKAASAGIRGGEALARVIAETVRDIAPHLKDHIESVRRIAQKIVDEGHPGDTPNTDALLKSIENVRASRVDFTARRVTETPPKGEPEGPVTSARNAMMAEDRKALGLDALDGPERRGWQAALDTAVARGVPEKALRLAAEVNQTPRPLTDIETAGLVHKANALKAEHRALSAELADLKDPADIQTKAAEIGRVEAEFDALSTALKSAGTEQGRALASRKLTLDQDFSLVAMKSRAKAAKGAELTPAESSKIADLSKRMEETTARLTELEKQLAESRAEQTIKRESGRRRAKPTRDAEFKSLLAEAKSLLEKGCD